MLNEISRVLKNKGYYICISYGDPDIRNHYFENQSYKWGKLPQCPYKIFKPNIDEADKNIVFNENKEKNKYYYHYVYILEKGTFSFSLADENMMSSQVVNPKW